MHVNTPPPPVNTAPVLEARDLHVGYAGSGTVVEAATFRIERGEFVGIVGPNGGGKSTLLKSLVGLVPPSKGSALWWGRRLRRADRPRVAYVAQNVVHVDPRFPALVEEVALLGRVPRRGLFHRYTREDRELARQALAETGMEKFMKHRIGDLSGGQRQRVFLAKALAAEPEVLVLDEPTTGVDPAARADFYSLLTHLNLSHDMTILLVSHDSHALCDVVGRIIAVNRRLIFDGTPEEFDAQGGDHLAYGEAIAEQECRMDSATQPEDANRARA